ncbi:MAG: type II toxin-antitoxin system PemK/MazF family toxin [Iamia sp.]
MTRGEVWWSESSDWGRRPVLVLTREAAAGRLSAVLAALVTTVRRDIPTEVALDETDGLPRPCVVNLDNLATVPVGLLSERITLLGPDRMHEACRALAHATGC